MLQPNVNLWLFRNEGFPATNGREPLMRIGKSEPSRTERRRNSFGTWQVLLVIVLALLLVGAKGCKKKKQGVYKAQTASGDVYWYYAGENNWDSNYSWGGALWCQAPEPTGPPPIWCNADFPVTVNEDEGTITCTLNGGGGFIVGCNF